MIKINASVGELLDKISILKIKEEKINDEKKLLNIKKELGLFLQLQRSLLKRMKNLIRNLWMNYLR